MADFTLTIKKSDVYEEVAKTTAYIGAKNKLEDGKSAFDQVFVTDADLTMIERFFNSINSSANSFLVNSIIGKWCEITANDKVKEYADNAAALLLDIKDKAFFKKKPTRTKIS